MERMVFEAAVGGGVSSLLRLLQEDPLILDRVIVNCYNETPLHVAAMLGHVDFVKEILTRKPEFASELDSRLSSSLHLASAKGYLEIVKALLMVNHGMCLARDRDGRNPLHIAVIKGRVNVLKELVEAKPHAARVTVDRGETILHLCVKYNQLEALKLLVDTMGDDYHFLNSKDDDGNTILHLAVVDKQIETINFVLLSTSTEKNALNVNGFTAMDILRQSGRDVKDMDIGESLRRAGAFGANESTITLVHSHNNQSNSSSHSQQNSVEENLKKQDDWLEKQRGALMVVASLIASMAFQATENPPSVWIDRLKNTTESNPLTAAPVSDPPTMDLEKYRKDQPGYYYRIQYGEILLYNTTAFVASLSIILLLISGLPLRRGVFTWILTVIMWLAISAIFMSYFLLLDPFTEMLHIDTITNVIALLILLWMSVMCLLPLGHTIRLTVKIIRKSRERGSN